MKKWLLGLLTAMMAVSLAACTPTTEKQKETKSAAEAQTQMEAQTTGGASDKVPDPNVAPVAIISIYHKGDGDSLVQDMDSLDSDELDPQALVNKMMEYGIFTEGTEVLDFNITGEDDNKTAVLNLNQAENNEGVSDNAFLVEIGNTFVENFELSKLTLQVNGKDLAGAADLSEHTPQYSGYSFLPDGRYAAGVWLCSPEEVRDYVQMQKDYQHRVLICDRNDFAVMEIVEGKLVFPSEQDLQAFPQQPEGGIQMG